jgi:flavin reductase (DIM6/NTAB) family NADH-FMN oxidoreductase RutF
VINSDALRSTLGQFTTGIILITTLDLQGRFHGMTANSFTSVSLSPPLILVCVGVQNQTHNFISVQKKFGVNILSTQQRELSLYFAKTVKERPQQDAPETMVSQNGIPCLQRSLGFLGCSLVAAHPQGDHTIYVGNVEEIITGGDLGSSPLIFYESSFRELDPKRDQ